MTSSPGPNQDTEFSNAIAATAVGEGRLDAVVHDGWDIRGNPHGGYLMAMAANAARSVSVQQDPLSVSATYLAPPQFGPAELTVDVVRAGRRQSTVAVELRQDGSERVRATVTLGTLPDADPIPLSPDAANPDGPDRPGPDQGIARTPTDESGQPFGLHQRIELRFHPATGFLSGQPSGDAKIDAWLRMADGSNPDPLILLMFSDGVPPSIFEARGRQVGHVPTIQLTTHLFARPEPGWIRARARTRVQAGSLIDEDCDLFDSAGRLVATARQLALLR